MTKLIAISGIAAFLILNLFFLSFAQESLTITTYYPSPYGSYNQLTSNSAKIGATYSQAATPFVANSLLVEGNVGIGTTTPTQKLEVNGKIKVNTGGSANKTVCWKADNTLGYCSTAVDASGGCTCN